MDKDKTVSAVREVVEKSERPKDLGAYDVVVGSDSTDEPSTFIIFYVKPGMGSDKAWVAQVSAYVQKLETALLKKIPERWPYVQLEEKSAKSA